MGYIKGQTTSIGGYCRVRAVETVGNAPVVMISIDTGIPGKVYTTVSLNLSAGEGRMLADAIYKAAEELEPRGVEVSVGLCDDGEDGVGPV